MICLEKNCKVIIALFEKTFNKIEKNKNHISFYGYPIWIQFRLFFI